MSQYRYFGKGAQCSAVMKADYARIRKAHSERYATRLVEEVRMAPDGYSQQVKVRAQPDAVPMTPKARHNFAMVPWGRDIL